MWISRILPTMDNALTWFIRVWIALFIAINLLGMAATFAVHGFWGGISEVQRILNPFNIANIIFQIMLLSPALAAYWWREKRRVRRLTRNKETDWGHDVGKERF